MYIVCCFDMRLFLNIKHLPRLIMLIKQKYFNILINWIYKKKATN